MAAIELSTAGIKLGWAPEVTVGVRPVAGYTRVRGVKSIPSFNAEPATLEVTDLNDLEWKRYIPGLKDVGGALAFTCNFTQQLMDDWGDIMDAFDTAKAAGLRMWFHVNVPDLADGFFFAGEPSPLGLPEAGVDAVLEADVFITPTYIEGFRTKVAIAEP